MTSIEDKTAALFIYNSIETATHSYQDAYMYIYYLFNKLCMGKVAEEIR